MSLFDTTGGRGIKFANNGDNITGTISRPPYEKQQTVFGSEGKPAVYDNGDPKMQILVSLSTALREDSDDDGERTLYVASKKMKSAIADAMRAAGAKDIEVGGTLTVTFTGFDPNSKNAQNPAKTYAAAYAKPSTAFAAVAVAAGVALPAQQEQWAATPPAAPVAAAQPYVAGAPSHGVPEDVAAKAKQLIGLGLGADQITAALGITAEQVEAIRTTP